jgi:ribose 1,5-bisphosphokinase
MEEQGRFALKWHIYGLDYGVSIEIDEWLKDGHPVVVNVSRMIIEGARNTYENIRVVFIEVPFELTVKRIKERGRENEEGLKKRIERARTHQKLPEADFVVNNSSELDEAIEQFLHFVLRVVEKNK